MKTAVQFIYDMSSGDLRRQPVEIIIEAIQRDAWEAATKAQMDYDNRPGISELLPHVDRVPFPTPEASHE